LAAFLVTRFETLLTRSGVDKANAGLSVTCPITTIDQEVEMNFGMMWFDNDPKTELAAKINRAAEYYRSKYGRTPNLCMVHPKAMTENMPIAGNITVRPQQIILPGHLWIGLEEKES
jgi:hypothetical protein